MLRYLYIIIFLFIATFSRAQWSSINIDIPTTTAMTAAFTARAALEDQIQTSITNIRKNYVKTELAMAGILSVKFVDRNAIKRAGVFDEKTESFYYQHIYTLLTKYIIPKLFNVTILFLETPQDILYWGPYLARITADLNELTATFQEVCANGKVDFKDILIPTIKEWAKPYLTLYEQGMGIYEDVDYLIKNLKNIDVNKIKDDFRDAGKTIAILAGIGKSEGDSILHGLPTSSDIFSFNIAKYQELGKKYKKYFDDYSSPERIYRTLLSKISPDSTGVLDILEFRKMSFEDFMNRYKKDDPNQYCRQRWYIYWESGGEEVVCDYTPDYTKLWLWNSNRRGPWAMEDWGYFEARFGSRGLSGFPDTYDDGTPLEDVARQASESNSGWSQTKVNQLNSTQSEFVYKITYEKLDYRCGPGSHDNLNPNLPNEHHGDYDRAVGYKIKVTRSWNSYGEVYEEYFDSYKMTEEVFEQHMKIKLASIEASNDVEGRTFKIGKDEPQYYTATDAEKMKGVSTVNFTRQCNDGAKLGEGSFSWKVNESHDVGSPTDYSKELAMATKISEDKYNIANVDNTIKSLEEEVKTLTANVSDLEKEQSKLLSRLTLDPTNSSLNKQIKEVEAKLSLERKSLTAAKDSLSGIKRAREELVNDYADAASNDHDRIPKVMATLAAAYEGNWIDDGHWEGNTFIRQMNIPSMMNGTATFRANLSLLRGESWFIIRYHRSILGVSWELTSSYSSEENVETMYFDNSISDEEKANRANARQRELMEDSPGCTINMEYAAGSSVEQEEGDDGRHLLWMSERLAIAREITSKLTTMYADLILIEKWCCSRRSILDMFTQPFKMTISKGRNGATSNPAFRRWQDTMEKAMRGEYPTERDDD